MNHFSAREILSGRYVVCIDPLDGSSNIDVNATIGTIFGVFRRKSPEGTPAQPSDLLQTGRDMMAAGYIIYGSGTVLVLSTGDGVYGFTLDPLVGEFFLSHRDIRLTPSANTYSINEGYAAKWDPRLRAHIEAIKDGEDSWKARYIGSLVADFHRNLLKGGILCTPEHCAIQRESCACSMKASRWHSLLRPQVEQLLTECKTSWTSPRVSITSAPVICRQH